MRDPFEGVSVRGRRAMLLTAVAAVLLLAYGLVFPTQVAIVGVVLTLPLIIMLHEAGHFFTAKRTGMKVTEFFIGFGPGSGRSSAARPSTASRPCCSAVTAASSA